MKESADGSGRVASQLQGHSEVIYDIAAIVPPAMPYAMRILLENSVRHFGLEHPQTKSILNWRQAASSGHVIDVMASRAFLHDTNGVPVLTDFAAMRDAVIELGGNPELVNPQIPAELTIDHSVIADVFGSSDAAEKNVAIEFERNNERYRFLRWGQKNFKNLKVVPPGAGIMHQINCEYLARVVEEREGVAFPDLCLGTDSHTTMVNGVGVLAWGIGGIEAEAVMLGEAYSMVVPEVVGVRLVGELNKVANATDLVLTITERLRAHGVVGKFVEFFGPALKNTTVADRTTIANMAPEFGSTCAYFPIDDQTLSYLAFTGRPAKQIELVRDYAKHQKLWHDENLTPDYQEVIELDLSEIVSSIAGPRKPQDRISLSNAKSSLHEALPELRSTSGTNTATFTLPTGEVKIEDGAVAIAAITSCTNTSNPSVMVAAGLLAKKAAQKGIYAKPWVKTTLSPGSKVVTDYLDSAGLTQSLEGQGFYLAGYGCMTCIGASGGLVPEVEQAVRNQGLTVAAVLSGNRNFDGRINPDIRLNYLASPPLVVAYALAGSMDIDFEKDELGLDSFGEKVMLKDLWPSPEEIKSVIEDHIDSSMYEKRYAKVFDGNELWQSLPVPEGVTYAWEEESTYLRKPTFMDNMPEHAPGIQDIDSARVLAKLGDQITTDHLSPAGAIPAASVAGKYLESLGTKRSDLNTYASRRGNLEVMMRGTLANVRLRNELVPGHEGNQTLDFVDSETKSIYDAAMNYKTHSVPLIILGGKLYGAGSSRDWGAKGPALLGIRAVIAESFERIHRSNLICMGILPLEYLPGDSATSLGLTGHERFTISDLGEGINQRTVWVEADDKRFEVQVRLETPRERDYLNHGGVLQYVLRKLARP
jgi:aconitate hydratase